MGRWSENRAKRRDCEVLGALVHFPEGASALLIARYSRRPPGSQYVSLARLERRGEIVSWWTDGPAPRRRVYALNPELRTGVPS